MRYRLRQIRERRVMSQRELAAKAGVAHSTVVAIEQGGIRAHPKTLRRLAEALGVEAGELLMEEDLDKLLCAV